MTNEEVTLLIKQFADAMTDDEATVLKEQVTVEPEDKDEKLWATNILDAADLLKRHKGNDKAIGLLQEAYKEWNVDHMNAYPSKADILRQTCYFLLEAKKLEDAHKTMNRYMYNVLKQVGSIHPSPKMRYYSFRNFSQYSLKDIREETISLAHPREFNDPLDTILVWWLDDEIKKGTPSLDLDFKILMKKAAEHIKIRCLIGAKYKDKDGVEKERKVEDLNVIMWAHYAKSHTGFCVEYEFDRDKLNMNYRSEEDKVDLIQAIKYVDSINLHGVQPSMDMALFQKSSFWDYENEIRLCSFDSTSQEEYPVIKCKGAIKAIYLGAKCSAENRREMEKAIADKDIPLFQMSVDENVLTRFKKTQIG